MSRGLFSNQNQVGESYSFTTNKNGIFYWYIDKHDPSQYPVDRLITITPTPSRNIRIDYGDGSQPESPILTQIAAAPFTSNSQVHTYGDGSDKVITFTTDKLEEIRYFKIGWSTTVNDVFTGKTNLDLTPFTKLYDLAISRNSNITGVTFNTDGTQPMNNLYLNNCDLTGTLVLSGVNMTNIGTIDIGSNSNLTEITFPTGVTVNGNNFIDLCNLSGYYDLSTWSGIGSQFNWSSNSITGITFPNVSTGAQNGIFLNSNDLTGSLDLSPLSGCGRAYNIYSNLNLTNIIFPSNTINCIIFEVYSCDLRNLDISTVSGLTSTSTDASSFKIGSNSNLSAVTTTDGLNTLHTDIKTSFHINDTNLPYFNLSGSTFDDDTVFWWHDCPSLSNLYPPTHPVNINATTIRGYDSPSLTDIDISAFNVGDQTPSNTIPVIDLHGCTSLSGLTLPSAVKSGQTHFSVHDCNLSGSLDLSNYTGLMKFDVSENSGLTSLTLPTTISIQTLTDASMFSITSQKTFQANNCDLGYVDFKPMSGLTLNSSSTILLQNNNMTTGEVNHILVDFVTTTWDGVTLDISGTNAAPDSISGGFDGISAISTLTGGTNNWTIITS